MSWLVENIIKNRLQIRQKSDIESDQYNDLLMIENKINELYKEGILSGRDVEILSYVAGGNLISDANNGFGVVRQVLSKEFSSICDRVAFYLGGYFTDTGYLHYMKNKYKLSAEQTKRMEEFMKSSFRHSIIRKPYNE